MDRRHENFLRISKKRIEKIVFLVRQLGNLNNKSFYDYSDEEILKMFEIFESELAEQKRILTKGNNKFKL